MEVSEAKKSQWKNDEELKALGARDVRARTVAVAKPLAAARVAWRFLEGATAWQHKAMGAKTLAKTGSSQSDPRRRRQPGARGCRQAHMSAKPEQASDGECLAIEKAKKRPVKGEDGR